MAHAALATKASRRYEYFIITLDEINGVVSVERVEVTAECVQITVLIKNACRRYQLAISRQTLPDLHTLTHLLPRKTNDPLLTAFRHRTTRDCIVHRIILPPEVHASAVKLNATLGSAAFLQCFRRLLVDLQPVTDRALLAWRSRTLATYDTDRMIAAVCRHALKWNFDPCNLVNAFHELGDLAYCLRARNLIVHQHDKLHHQQQEQQQQEQQQEHEQGKISEQKDDAPSTPASIEQQQQQLQQPIQAASTCDDVVEQNDEIGNRHEKIMFVDSSFGVESFNTTTTVVIAPTQQQQQQPQPQPQPQPPLTWSDDVFELQEPLLDDHDAFGVAHEWQHNVLRPAELDLAFEEVEQGDFQFASPLDDIFDDDACY